MADKKISQLNSAAPLAGTEVLPIVQGGSTVKTTVESVVQSPQPSATANAVAFLDTNKKLSSNGEFQYDGRNLAVGQAPSAWLSSVRSIQAGPAFSIWGLSTLGRMTTNAYLDGSGTSRYQIDGFATEYRSSAGAQVFYTAASGLSGGAVSFEPVLTLAADKNVAVDAGNLVMGTAGKGIDFSANANAPGMTSEVLNDYEEGTFTPVVTPGSGTLTSYGASGRYTKIGNTVTIHVSYLIIDTGTSGGIAFLSGFPFTSKAAGSYIVIGVARDVATAGGQEFVLVQSNNTTGLLLNPVWNNGAQYEFSVTYLTA